MLYHLLRLCNIKYSVIRTYIVEVYVCTAPCHIGQSSLGKDTHLAEIMVRSGHSYHPTVPTDKIHLVYKKTCTLCMCV